MTSDKSRRSGFQPRSIIWATVAVASLCLPLSLASDEEWKIAAPDYDWNFPQDHWARDGYKTEWWYFTGHLEAENVERFGYQFTFFRVGLLRDTPDVDSEWKTKDLIMGHVALSSLPPLPGRGVESKAKSHRFSEVLYRAVPLLGGFGEYPDERVAWSRGPAGTEGDWELRWNGEAFDFKAKDDELGFGFELSTTPMKNAIFQGPNGYSKKGEGVSAASQYYSFTRLKTEGSVEIDGQVFEVTGQSWMDKEFFTNSLSTEQVGWDWFSLQLDDNRELMLYVVRDAEGSVNHARGTLVNADGSTRFLEANHFSISDQATWTSPTGDAYPSRWSIAIPSADIDIRIVSQLADQENRSRLIPTLRYWEGAVTVENADGKPIGVGFVEMTGYGTASTPAL